MGGATSAFGDVTSFGNSIFSEATCKPTLRSRGFRLRKLTVFDVCSWCWWCFVHCYQYVRSFFSFRSQKLIKSPIFDLVSRRSRFRCLGRYLCRWKRCHTNHERSRWRIEHCYVGCRIRGQRRDCTPSPIPRESWVLLTCDV